MLLFHKQAGFWGLFVFCQIMNNDENRKPRVTTALKYNHLTFQTINFYKNSSTMWNSTHLNWPCDNGLFTRKIAHTTMKGVTIAESCSGWCILPLCADWVPQPCDKS